MNISRLFLLGFCAGCFILFIGGRKPRWDLKERALHYMDRGRSLAKKSHIARLAASVKISLYKNAVLGELSQSLAYINNLVILGRGKSISSQLLLEELSEFCPKLKPVYMGMIHELRLNNRQSAAKLLAETSDDSIVSDIGLLLAGWEDVSPDAMTSTVETYRSTLSGRFEAKKQYSDELLSDIIYMPVVLNCMIVLLNFIYIAFFLEQQNMLSQFI